MIQYSKNTVGCNVGGNIFIHPELYRYPELYTAIVEHEKKHTGGLSLKDIALDLNNDELAHVKKDFYLFILKHPRTLLGWLPITKIGRYWSFDAEMLIVWLSIALIFWFIWITI